MKIQEIDDEIANQIIGVMLYLDSEDSSKPIYLYINCPGGSVIAGLALFDTMQHVKSPIVTINLGLAVRSLNMRRIFHPYAHKLRKNARVSRLPLCPCVQ